MKERPTWLINCVVSVGLSTNYVRLENIVFLLINVVGLLGIFLNLLVIIPPSNNHFLFSIIIFLLKRSSGQVEVSYPYSLRV